MIDTPKNSVLSEYANTVEHLSVFGEVIANSLYYLAGAILLIVVVHKLARKYLFPRLAKKRHAVVLILALHALVLLSALLLVIGRLGFDISQLAPVALLVVIMLTILLMFIAPLLPKLPFTIGDMVEIEAVQGNVVAVTPVFTHLQTFDGRSVFIPNATVWAKKIINYHYTPNRRIELNLKVSADHGLAEARALLTDIMASDERVLDNPAPATRLNSARAEGVDMLGLCWVENANFLDARSDLYNKLVQAAQTDTGISLALDQQIALSGEVVQLKGSE